MIAAKVLASATAGVAVGLLAAAVAAALESAGLAVRGSGIEISAADFIRALAGGAVSAALFAALGVGDGALLRNPVCAVVGLCVWLLLVETTLIGNVPAAGKFAPEASAGALAGAIQTQSASTLLGPVLGALLLALYTGIAAVAGVIATNRREVA
ncbi:MAG: hypothetical protein AB7V58_00705 [Solirubrobacterales bacterium]